MEGMKDVRNMSFAQRVRLVVMSPCRIISSLFCNWIALTILVAFFVLMAVLLDWKSLWLELATYVME